MVYLRLEGGDLRFEVGQFVIGVVQFRPDRFFETCQVFVFGGNDALKSQAVDLAVQLQQFGFQGRDLGLQLLQASLDVAWKSGSRRLCQHSRMSGMSFSGTGWRLSSREKPSWAMS